MGKKEVHEIFSFFLEFKMRVKAVCNINHAFGPGMISKCTDEHWFYKFHNGKESLEDEEGHG